MGTTFIVGTTASGKTKLALKFAQASPSILISADSRQVYKEMNIVSGKDHPENIDIKGINLVNPNDDFSVSHWYDSVKTQYLEAIKQGKHVIVVGGTGFYVRALTHGIETINIPPDRKLRAELKNLSVGELQEILKHKDHAKFNQLNHSDKSNPRRLVRAIEVASVSPPPLSTLPLHTKPLIGLYYQDQELHKNMIRKRVISRLDAGAIKETEALLSKYGLDSQGMSALGYLQIRLYLEGKITQSELIELWTTVELQYAKRQLTFFRKLNVIWYDRGRMSLEEIYEHLSS